MKIKKEETERGSAGLIINLSDGKVIVEHIEDKTILYQSKVKKGYWDNLWESIRSWGLKNNG